MGVATKLFMCHIFVLIVIGLYNYLVSVGENKCEMTYMFEFPQYLKLRLKESIVQQYPAYNLYLYGEGTYAQEHRHFDMRGIPVLFIPGNAGSYRQVRSLGSVAYRMAISRNVGFRFDFFSIDFNEELSGLNGALLSKQTEFLAECIKKILSMYDAFRSPPSSVVLVGHSMGGTLARGVLTLKNFSADAVDLIITQASPHQHPVLLLDNYLSTYFREMNTFWQENCEDSLQHITLLSTSGGPRDLLVRSDVSSLRGLFKPGRALHTNTMSVPKAWVSTDHLCHVWCKQIVMATVRALFDMVDRKNKQISKDPEHRMKVLKYYFSNDPGDREFRTHFSEFHFTDDRVLDQKPKKSFRFHANQTDQTMHTFIRVPKSAKPNNAFIAVSNFEGDAWLLGCQKKKEETECSSFINYADQAFLLPPSGRKAVLVPPPEVGKHTDMLVVVPKSKSQVNVAAELVSANERDVSYNVSSFWNFILLLPTFISGSETVITQTAADAVAYNVRLHGLETPLQAYVAYLDRLSCKPNTSGETAMKFFVPWNNEDVWNYYRVTENATASLSLKLQMGRPTSFESTASPMLQLFLDPACRYSLSIGIHFRDFLGQFARFYLIYLPVYLVAQILMVLSCQFKTLDDEEYAPGIVKAHGTIIYSLRVIPAAMATTWLFFSSNSFFDPTDMIPPDDRISLRDNGRWHSMLPVLLYVTAYAIFMVYSHILVTAFTIMGHFYSLIIGRLIQVQDLNQLCNKLLLMVALSCLPVSVSTCGSLGLLIMYVCFIIKTMLSYMVALNSPLKTRDIWSEHNVLLSISLLLMVQVGLNLPPLVTWIRQQSYGELHLEPDPSLPQSIMTCIPSILLLVVPVAPKKTDWLSFASYLLYMCSPALLVICPASLSVLSVAIGVTLISLTVTYTAVLVISPPSHLLLGSRLKEYDALPANVPRLNGDVAEVDGADEFKQIR